MITYSDCLSVLKQQKEDVRNLLVDDNPTNSIKKSFSFNNEKFDFYIGEVEHTRFRSWNEEYYFEVSIVLESSEYIPEGKDILYTIGDNYAPKQDISVSQDYPTGVVRFSTPISEEEIRRNFITNI